MPDSDPRDTQVQALIDKGACIACLTFERHPHGNFCNFTCSDYYLFCQARFLTVKWRDALRGAEEEFQRRKERHGTEPPKRISVSE